MKDDSPFVFAGLWEGWKNPTSNEWLHTCTIITGEPNDLVAQIQTRMNGSKKVQICGIVGYIPLATTALLRRGFRFGVLLTGSRRKGRMEEGTGIGMLTVKIGNKLKLFIRPSAP